MCLLGATHNVWCSMASAAVASAAVVGTTVVGAVMIPRCSRGWCAEWCAVWCKISVAVVGVMGSVLYGASVVQLWLAQQCVCSNSRSINKGCYLCVEWCVELCVAQCQIVLSRDTQSDVWEIERDDVRR